MVTHDPEVGRQPLKNAFSRMCDEGCFAVHGPPRQSEPRTEKLANALVAEADAQHGPFIVEMRDERHQKARIAWPLGARGKDEAIKAQALETIKVQGVVAKHAATMAQLPKIIVQIVSERIVIVHQQYALTVAPLGRHSHRLLAYRGRSGHSRRFRPCCPLCRRHPTCGPRTP